MDSTVHAPLLTNAVGHLAGLIAFGAFLLLLDRSARLGRRSRLSAPAAAAALAFLWNLGSLVVLLMDANSAGRELVASLSFAVLSMLPCVLLHLALGREYVALRIAGYLCGVTAAVVHLLEASGAQVASHSLGIDVITYGFGALAVASLALLARGGADRRPAVTRASLAISLFLLAASFVHFETETGPGSWTHELVFHHAAIPLALFVLLQDYRFLLLDAFVRFLGAAFLAAGFSTLLLSGLLQLGWLSSEAMGQLGGLAFVLAVSASILLYPIAQQAIGRWLDPILFRRGSIDATLGRIRAIEGAPAKPFCDQVARVVAEFVSARRWALSEQEEPASGRTVEALDDRGSRRRPETSAWAEVSVALRVAPGRTRKLWLGPRNGGRRYLGADLTDLEALAAAADARLETIRRDEQQRLLAEAELQALRAQINPHFLFNALNALYGVIPRAAPGARKTLLNLADILRYSLDNKRQQVALDEELRVVEAYLAIERLRLADRLAVRIECDDAARSAKIPAFSVQPLVENAVKHGISGKPSGGGISVDIGLNDDRLRIEVRDDGVGFEASNTPGSGHGLRNVQRRLELCYGDDTEFEIDSEPGRTCVRFTVPAAADTARIAS